jgi:hypothetical protein
VLGAGAAEAALSNRRPGATRYGLLGAGVGAELGAGGVFSGCFSSVDWRVSRAMRRTSLVKT